MHLVGDGFVWVTNLLARIIAGSNEVFLLLRWGIWDGGGLSISPTLDSVFKRE